MTAAFDALLDGPRTGIGLGDLAYDERVHVRRIRPTAGSDADPERRLGRITPVVYLVGDERAAAELFVAENEDALRQLSFDGSGRNPIESNVDRPIYDWILHALGRRRLDPYETTVIEYRPDPDVTWCVDREAFVNRVDRRYSTSHPDSAKVDGTLPALFVDLLADAVEENGEVRPLKESEGLADLTTVSDDDWSGIAPDAESLPALRLDDPVTITPDDLDEHGSVTGNRRQPLDAIRVDPRFDVEPITVDEDIALLTYGFDDGPRAERSSRTNR